MEYYKNRGNVLNGIKVDIDIPNNIYSPSFKYGLK